MAEAPPPSRQKIGPYLSLGATLAGCVVVGVFFGRWLDGELGTEPWCLLGGSVVGIAAGFYHFFKVVLNMPTSRSLDSGAGIDADELGALRRRGNVALWLLIGAALGYWLDGRLETGPWFLLIGGVVFGLVGGYYHLVVRKKAGKKTGEKAKGQGR